MYFRNSEKISHSLISVMCFVLLSDDEDDVSVLPDVDKGFVLIS